MEDIPFAAVNPAKALKGSIGTAVTYVVAGLSAELGSAGGYTGSTLSSEFLISKNKVSEGTPQLGSRNAR
jgi:hypothetical protein